MIKYVNYDIVFQEFPDEVTLAINCSLCPNSCPGCHSAYLAGDVGDELTESRLMALVEEYRDDITCVALMGGDNDPAEVQRLLEYAKKNASFELKAGWYSGRDHFPEGFRPEVFDYVKIGPYRSQCGPLKSPSTNQRLYRFKGREKEDITGRFWKK